jgi:hypothetical protein
MISEQRPDLLLRRQDSNLDHRNQNSILILVDLHEDQVDGVTVFGMSRS